MVFDWQRPRALLTNVPSPALAKISYVPHSPVSMKSLCPTSFVRDTNIKRIWHSPADLDADKVAEANWLTARK